MNDEGTQGDAGHADIDAAIIREIRLRNFEESLATLQSLAKTLDERVSELEAHIGQIETAIVPPLQNGMTMLEDIGRMLTDLRIMANDNVISVDFRSDKEPKGGSDE